MIGGCVGAALDRPVVKKFPFKAANIISQLYASKRVSFYHIDQGLDLI